MFQELEYKGTNKSKVNKYTKNVAQCHTACEYYTYDSSITSTKWPTASFRTQFKKLLEHFRAIAQTRKTLNRPVRNDPKVLTNILRKMSVYEEIDKLALTNKSAAWKKLSETDFIERNFLAIIVSRSDFTIVRVEEKAVFTLTSLLSQSGGLLSIWIGLTFICIVEVIELFLNVFDTYTQQNRNSWHNLVLFHYIESPQSVSVTCIVRCMLAAYPFPSNTINGAVKEGQ